MSDFCICGGKLAIATGERNNLDKLIKSKPLLENDILHLYLGVERLLTVDGSTKSFASIISNAMRYQAQGCHRAWKTWKTWNSLIFQKGAWKTWKSLEFLTKSGRGTWKNNF